MDHHEMKTTKVVILYSLVSLFVSHLKKKKSNMEFFSSFGKNLMQVKKIYLVFLLHDRA